MSTGNLHLIVTCTRRKTVTAGQTIFPDERDAGRAYGVWLERLAQTRRGSPPMTAGELYTASTGAGLLQLRHETVLRCGLYPQARGYCISLIPWSRMRRYSPRCRSAIALTGND
ncbi:hypothetical protein [Enterobacter ludwigii]|uniref:hypothetical protein n=1 Tax=Enterobacter ludwigii TaxID=299767 RepID=UPI003EF3BA33